VDNQYANQVLLSFSSRFFQASFNTPCPSVDEDEDVDEVGEEERLTLPVTQLMKMKMLMKWEMERS